MKCSTLTFPDAPCQIRCFSPTHCQPFLISCPPLILIQFLRWRIPSFFCCQVSQIHKVPLGQILLCKIPPRFDHHNINTKVCLFNELLVECFLDTEDFLMVVNTVQPEIKFYDQDGLHLSNVGIAKLCGIILSKLYKVLAPASHRSRVRTRQNRHASDRRHSNSKGHCRISHK